MGDFTVTYEHFKDYCLSLTGTALDFPFDAETPVFRRGKKIFALVRLGSNPLEVNLKCDPGLARDLRDSYPEAVRPGFHMNKTHWNTITQEKGLSERLFKDLIHMSWDLVGSHSKKRVPTKATQASESELF